jgi:hypothetical protein
MLTYLARQPSTRKMQLFACAACRGIWPQLTDSRTRAMIEAAEKFADGLVSPHEFKAAIEAGRKVVGWNTSPASNAADYAALAFSTDGAANAAAHIARCAGRQPSRGIPTATQRGTIRVARKLQQKVQCDLLREILGNPFRPVTIDPHWLAWQNSTILHLALVVYQDRAFDHLPILADALEEAGCADAALLHHLRGPGPHAKGCWVVDAILDNP